MAYQGHDNQLAFWPYSLGHIWGRQPLDWIFLVWGQLLGSWFLDLGLPLLSD